jgi:hypothetical protein
MWSRVRVSKARPLWSAVPACECNAVSMTRRLQGMSVGDTQAQHTVWGLNLRGSAITGVSPCSQLRHLHSVWPGAFFFADPTKRQSSITQRFDAHRGASGATVSMGLASTRTGREQFIYFCKNRPRPEIISGIAGSSWACCLLQPFRFVMTQPSAALRPFNEVNREGSRGDRLPMTR